MAFPRLVLYTMLCRLTRIVLPTFPPHPKEAIGGREYSSSHVQKLDNSPTPSVAAPALATYIGDVEMGQPGSNSMSTASRDNSVIDPGGSGTLRKVEYARSPDRLMEAQEMHEMQVAPSNAEIQDMPQVNAMRSTVHSMPRAEGMPALSDAEGPQSSGGGCRVRQAGSCSMPKLVRLGY